MKFFRTHDPPPYKVEKKNIFSQLENSLVEQQLSNRLNFGIFEEPFQQISQNLKGQDANSGRIS